MQVRLILGGMRSGKTRRALHLARTHAGQVVHIATARDAGDDPEWSARIAHHRRERPRHWLSVEAPLALVRAMRFWAAPGRLLVVDCISVWIANLLLAGRDWRAETEALADVLQRAPGSAMLISNEAGWGLVPQQRLGRAFCDALGWTNQKLAAQAARVEMVVAGRVLPLAPPTEEEDACRD